MKTEEMFIECDKKIISGLDENNPSGITETKTKVIEKWGGGVERMCTARIDDPRNLAVKEREIE